jgi:hypothetical protein
MAPSNPLTALSSPVSSKAWCGAAPPISRA